MDNWPATARLAAVAAAGQLPTATNGRQNSYTTPGDTTVLVERWLPDGRREGREWAARNPRRVDRRPGSFKVNLETGRWADFALSDAKGGDPVALLAYLRRCTQTEAARALARMLGVES